MTKYVYTFGGKTAEGKADMKNLLGGKGANLAEMCLLGLPVPAGLTITTECCTAYYANNCELPKGLMDEVWKGVENIEKIMGMKYDDAENPLLVSCRSGARSSMPGMMDTVLNIGLSSKTIPGMLKKTNNPRFVYDSYRRLIMMYADVVMEKAEGIEPADGKGIRKQLDDMLDEYKGVKGYKSDTELTAEDLKKLAEAFKVRVKEVLGVDFPDDARAQMEGGIKAVFKSWNGKKAVSYRKIEGIPDDWGTAVNVQAMVFGNMGDTSATGVAFTRNPATGDNQFYGEWLINAQGEDVVAGIRTPNPLNDDTKNEQNKHMHSMQELMPETYKELCDIRSILEKNYHDMLDIEFTIQDGKLYMLQCRVGKRTGVAALTMAMDMLKEGLIDESEVVMRISPAQLDELLHPILDSSDEKKHIVLAKGLPAGPGGAVGVIALTSEKAKEYQAAHQEHPRARGDEPRGCGGHACRRRHPHRPWRHDVARCPRGPRMGQVLHRGLRRREDRAGEDISLYGRVWQEESKCGGAWHSDYQRQDLQGGRPAEPQRHEGLRLRRGGEDDRRHREPAVPAVHEDC